MTDETTLVLEYCGEHKDFIPGKLYTFPNREHDHLQAELGDSWPGPDWFPVYIVKEPNLTTLPQWPSFWHYPPEGEDSPRSVSGRKLIGGKGAHFLYTGQRLRDLLYGYSYLIFLFGNTKIAVERTYLQKLEKSIL